MVPLAAAMIAIAFPAISADPLLTQWLQKQPQIQSWSAQVKQTRTLKALANPLVSTGKVWFAAPNQFRWELGNPPETIAVRGADEMVVIYPRLKRAERYPLTGNQLGPWRDALTLLEAGFPRNQQELEARFRIVGEATRDEIHEITLQPKAPGAKRMIPQIQIGFSTRDFNLKYTSLRFADGSTMRNDFIEPVLNPSLPPDLFKAPIGADFSVVEPLKKP